jgi:BirA family biotin operon repressor/biotin-[acetyl-CoA-carboxylase] ligase
VVTRSASTNSQLLETDAAADPQALFAEHQTAGRGRRGRAWASPFGANWYLSIGWSFPSWPARITTLPLAVAVMVCRALSRAGVAQAGIKWPNDIQVQGQKLAGILIEPRGEAGGACRVVVGVGVNGAMSTAQAETVTQPWVSLMPVLAAAGVPLVERNTVAAMLVDELAQGLAHFAAHGFAPFAAEWRSRDVLRDQPVRIEGSPVEQGTARGVDADGGLLLDTSQGRVVIHAGDVSVRAA